MIRFMYEPQASRRSRSQSGHHRLLKLSPQRVSVLVKTGQLKAVEVAGRPLVSKRELEHFAAIPRKGGGPR